jgi:hypothetical protein
VRAWLVRRPPAGADPPALLQCRDAGRMVGRPVHPDDPRRPARAGRLGARPRPPAGPGRRSHRRGAAHPPTTWSCSWPARPPCPADTRSCSPNAGGRAAPSSNWAGRHAPSRPTPTCRGWSPARPTAAWQPTRAGSRSSAALGHRWQYCAGPAARPVPRLAGRDQLGALVVDDLVGIRINPRMAWVVHDDGPRGGACSWGWWAPAMGPRCYTATW